jgi:hypothetical protein
MAGAHAGHATWQNLAAFLDELRKNVGALVVDEIHLLDTKLADFLLAEILALAATRTSWTTRSAGPAFATASTGSALAAASAGMSTLATFPWSGRRCARRLFLFF